MDDPNIVYKRAFAELREELGRIPTANELLGLHDQYKRAWAPAEETVLPPTREEVPARKTVPDLMAALEASLADAKASIDRARASQSQAGEPLSGPGIIPTREEAVSAPEPPENKPGAAEGPCEGDRGPGGGLMCKCQACGRLWERERKAGRPAYTCEECR